MAVTGSGQIAITNLVTEFGGNAPHAISEYYRGQEVPDVSANNAVPTSGQVSMSNFYSTVDAVFNTATGGTITTNGDYKIHTFNSNGTFTVSGIGNSAGSNTFEYLVIAGGGCHLNLNRGGGGRCRGGNGDCDHGVCGRVSGDRGRSSSHVLLSLALR